jgi:hypothetical protein
MRKVIDSNKNVFGQYCGTSIYSPEGTVIYRILENEIFSFMKCESSDFEVPYKGLLGLVGEIRGNVGFATDNETLFTITA